MWSANHIEFIGSVCTIIAERFFEKNEENLLTPELCKLLIAGLMDNTLNFQTGNTTERDRDVYRRLLQIGQLDETWKQTYFSSCYADAAGRLEESLKESVKIEKVSSRLPEIFAQMIFPNEECILDNLSKIKSSLREYDEWILNAISLEEEKSLIICSLQAVRDKVNGLFEDAEIHEFGLTLPRSILRKKIMKWAREMIL